MDKIFINKDYIPKNCKDCLYCHLDDDKVVYYCERTNYTVSISLGENNEIANRLKTNTHATCPFKHIDGKE